MTTGRNEFTFDELDDQAKESARSKYREGRHSCFDSREFTTMLMEQAAYWHRVKTELCFWSLNCCQGDGVAFYGRLDLDFLCAIPDESPDGDRPLQAELDSIIAKIQLLRSVGYTIDVKIDGGHGRYHHWNSMDVWVELFDGPEPDDRFRLTIEKFEPWSRVDPLIAQVLLACETQDCTTVLVGLDWLEEHGEDVTALRLLFSEEDQFETLAKTLENELQEYMKRVSKHIEQLGYEELDHQDSDEVIDENIRANDYRFDADGTML